MSVEMRKISNGNYAVNVTSEEQIPVEIQGRYATTVQTHNAVSVAGGATSSSSWIDVSGYDKVGLTLKNDASTSSIGNVYWSHDGVTAHGYDNAVIASNTLAVKAGITDVKAKYMRIDIANLDTVAHTMSAWAYLKS